MRHAEIDSKLRSPHCGADRPDPRARKRRGHSRRSRMKGWPGLQALGAYAALCAKLRHSLLRMTVSGSCASRVRSARLT